jgi:hypothetical protein
MDDTPTAAPSIPVYIGRLSKGAECVRTITEPEYTPAAPMPAIARPMMKATVLGAVAHINEPNSNMATAAR